MTLLNLCSFESQTTEDALATANAAVIASNAARTGTYSLRVNPTTTDTGYFEFGGYDAVGGEIHTFLGLTQVFVSFDLYVTTLPAALQEPIFSINRSNGNRQLNVSVQSDGTLQCVDNLSATYDGTAVLSPATWYHIEVSWNRLTGAFVLNVDGAADIDTTIATNSNAIARMRFGKALNENGQTVDFNYDNIVIDDAQFHADAEVALIVPVSNGTDTGWTNGSGSSDYTQINDIPPVTTTRIRSVAAASDDDITFDMTAAATAGTSGTIYGLLAAAEMEQGSQDSLAQFRVRSGATVDNGSSIAVTFASARHYGRIYETDPDTANAWTIAGLDAAEFGLRKPAADPDSCESESFYIEVAFKPAEGGLAFPAELLNRRINTLLRM